MPEHHAEPDEGYDLCAADDCVNALDDGEGWDGYCGTCADRIVNAQS